MVPATGATEVGSVCEDRSVLLRLDVVSRTVASGCRLMVDGLVASRADPSGAASRSDPVVSDSASAGLLAARPIWVRERRDPVVPAVSVSQRLRLRCFLSTRPATAARCLAEGEVVGPLVPTVRREVEESTVP